MKLSDNQAVQRRHFPGVESVVVIDDGPNRRSRKTSSMCVDAGVCKERDHDVQASPSTSADHRWFVMREPCPACQRARAGATG